MKNSLHPHKILFVISIFLVVSCSKNKLTDSKIDNKYHLTLAPQLKDSLYLQKIENFFEQGKEGYFKGKSNVPIYYKIFQQSNKEKVILISSGRTEAAIKYKELIFDFYKNGYSVFIFDHRGQGKSGRMTQNKDMGYIDDFQFYIDDMKYFFDNYLNPVNFQKKYLVAHSMGGAIGLTYLEQHPTDFDAASFSSPMLGFKPIICKLVAVLGDEKPKFAIGQSEYKDEQNVFKGNTLTGSKVRFDIMVNAYKKNPEARLGGATYSWLNKSCQQFEILFDNIYKIQTPFILFSAKNEQIVNSTAHSQFIDLAKKFGKNAKLYEIEDAQHELFIEKDQQRVKTISTTLDFFSKY